MTVTSLHVYDKEDGDGNKSFHYRVDCDVKEEDMDSAMTPGQNIVFIMDQLLQDQELFVEVANRIIAKNRPSEASE
jgi:hypothetical protein